MLKNFRRLGVLSQSLVAGMTFFVIYSSYMQYVQSFNVYDSLTAALIFTCAYQLTSLFLLHRRLSGRT
jgi:hypothetical protein